MKDCSHCKYFYLFESDAEQGKKQTATKTTIRHIASPFPRSRLEKVLALHHGGAAVLNNQARKVLDALCIHEDEVWTNIYSFSSLATIHLHTKI